MNLLLQPIYSEKRVAILGLGRSGWAAAKLLQASGASVSAFDDKEAAKDTDRDVKIDLFAGSAAAAGPPPDSFDLGVLSPGIDPAVPLVQRFLRAGVRLISEVELASTLDPTPAVAITGTNGKTTTTELTAAALAEAGVRSAAAGNIGMPWSELLLTSPKLDVVTLEVSSFQLERIESFRPRVAVWTNFTPDHLDRYPDVESYFAAKRRVFDFQTADDHAVVNFRDDLAGIRAQRITFSAHEPGADFSLRDRRICFRGETVVALDELQLIGRHNAENVMCVLGIARALGIEFHRVLPALRAYRPQAHRCELLGEARGVRWVNDSKATNLDAVAQALRALDGPVVLIAGGKDKGFSFAPLADLVAERVRHVVLIGESAERIAREWGGRVPCETAGFSLPDAVRAAAAKARAGDTILLAPGTSSFDMFKNYADRGDQFRRLAQAYLSDGSSATNPLQSAPS